MSISKQRQVATLTGLKRREALTAYLFLLPTLVGFLIFILGPMLATAVMSLLNWNLLTSPSFAGTGNYSRLLSDARLLPVFLATLKIGGLVVALNVGLGMVIALLLEGQLPNALRQLFRLSYFFPFVVSVSAVAIIWGFLMNKDLGLVNYALGLVGIERIPWLNSSDWSPVAVALITVWKNLGFNIIVFSGGLQTIPAEFYEAAEVDGASAWRKFRHITLPLLSPTTFFLLVINSINAFQIFAEPFILTQGGPGDASRAIVMYIHEKGFRSFEMGYASTVALSLFGIILILTLLQFRLSRHWIHYE